MCLIVHSPKGLLMDRDVFDYARKQNSDGIGIMSEYGVTKFLGKKSGKKAWRELQYLASKEAPYGIHFRWATHGQIIKALCHPFHAPNSEAYVMHNGIITQCTAASTDWASDSLVYVSQMMRNCLSPADAGHGAYFKAIEEDIGWGNKLLVYHADTKQFTIVNDEAGSWIEGLWYSNTYSLPALMVPDDERWGRFNYASSPTWYTGGDYLPTSTGSTSIILHDTNCPYRIGKVCTCGVSLQTTQRYFPPMHSIDCSYAVALKGTGKLADLPECDCRPSVVKPLLPGGPTLDTGDTARMPKLLTSGYYSALDADDDETELQDATIIGERAADRLDETPPTAEDMAWLRNQQLGESIKPFGTHTYSPLDKWADDNAYKAMLKRRASEVK